MGFDTLEPFLERREKGIIVLCRTSNPGAKDIQDLNMNGKRLYQIIASMAVGKLKEIRSIVGDMPFLVPGVGAQGGDVQKTVTNGKNSKGTGMIINSSRGIIYASKGSDFAEAARSAAERLRDEINQHR
jgi:orotidine-5'-phosphate decarboxylase